MAAYLKDYGNGFADLYMDKDGFQEPVHIVLNDVSNGFIHGYADFNNDGIYDDIIDTPIIEEICVSVTKSATSPSSTHGEDSSPRYYSAPCRGSFVAPKKSRVKAFAIVAGGFIAFAIISFLVTAARVIF